MCGIVGAISKNGFVYRDWFSKGIDSLTHRGPDAGGQWWSNDGRVGFGHRRLSIIDLSDRASQPMQSFNNELTIVFNGEIYNFKDLRRRLIGLGYRFNSLSDTEVVLNAYAEWGYGCVNRLNGMFTFSIFDKKDNSIFVARDRAGEKPLYYFKGINQFFFASELKALMQNSSLPRKINVRALDDLFSLGFIPGDCCILEGFKKLPPAHALRYDIYRDVSTVWRYWKLPEIAPEADLASENELVDELEMLLANAVSKQMVSDVPVGVLLSGGVDSSLVTALACRSSDRVKTFSIGFEGAATFDETAHAQLVAEHFSTEHVSLQAKPTEPELLKRLAVQLDEPMIDSSMLPTFLVSRLVKPYCSVVLGGDGGDELFGGYKHYSRLKYLEYISRGIPLNLRQFIGVISERLLPTGFRGKMYLNALSTDFQTSLPVIPLLFDAITRKKLFCNYVPLRDFRSDFITDEYFNYSDIIQRATRADFQNYLAEDILVKVDRSSMMNSVEVRAPFLDKDVVEFAFSSVPSKLKVSKKQQKIILKKLAQRLLPPEFDLERKQGFSIPMNDWLKKGSFRDFFVETLSCEDVVFDRKMIRKLFEGLDKGYNNGERLFALVQFELWRKAYNVSF
jgi:asparagine synthase (glutamine-hydrolysing)